MSRASIHGVLLVDKPRGPTSHDIVGLVRRRLGTSRVGHAGTLDPMASGLLVVLVGEGTKLEPFLSAADKCYVAGVSLGRATTTLDAEGDTTHEAPVGDDVRGELAALACDLASPAPLVRAALDAELARTEQVPPAYSAIHVDGVRSYQRARAGEEVILPPRRVHVLDTKLVSTSADPPHLDVELTVSKGYYVRAFARDLGAALDTAAHLDALERTRSGTFDRTGAIDITKEGVDVRAHVLSLADAASRHLTALRLDAAQERLVRNGRGLDPARVERSLDVNVGDRCALVDESSRSLIAVAERRSDELAVLRVFHDAP
ncbi:MAG: tRNA pseudouridine(55) synthase TruB [Polyangiaceae bacterium]|nr:tRNA pseudouridine(55) synthase TruB [Polyangiaceae bacterium]